MPNENLTAKFIDNISTPEKVTEYHDQNKKGLKLRITPHGEKSFYYRYYLAGKHYNYKIGNYSSCSLAEARKAAKKIEFQVSQGINPKEEEKRQQREAEQRITFADMAARFQKYYLPNKKPKTQADYNWGLQKYLIPEFGEVPIVVMRRRDISNFLEEVAAEHPTLANRLQALISVIINYAVEKEYLESNPIFKLKKKGEETSRDLSGW